MMETLKEIILNGQEVTFFTGSNRELSIQLIPGKASVFIGVRRCGKSTFLFQIIEKLKRQKVPKENILYINFFDDRLHNLKQEGIQLILEAYYSIYPAKKNVAKIHCFFDEIQTIPNWESFVERTLRTENCEVYITGSSAQMLSKEIASQMRGRALSWEIFPFSFSEFLDYYKIKRNTPFSTKERFQVQKAFEHYFSSGGFPEVIDQTPDIRRKIHQEYLSSILFRDIIERHDISHPRAILDMTYRLIDNAASLYTLNKLLAFLQSIGHKVPKTSLADYLTWLEDSFFLFTVRMYDASFSRSNQNPKKIYCIDHSFIQSVSSGILTNSGHLLENLIFVELRRRYPQVYYYKTKTAKEVDFLILKDKKERLLIQVCESLANPDTKKREVSALLEAMKELKVKTGTIITRHEAKYNQVDDNSIQVLPVWKFLLSDS